MPGLLRWNYIHSWLIFIGIISSALIGSTIPIIVLALISFIILSINQKNELKTLIPWGGYANYITAIRFLILTIIGLFHLPNRWIFVLALLAMILDGVDGYVARKFNHESKTGVLFDLEVDAVYVVVLSCIIWLNSILPAWILIAAVLRSLFVIIANVLKINLDKDKKTRLGPAIAGVHFTVLLMPFIVPYGIYVPLCTVSTVMIVISFVYSFVLISK